jgi:hypothetical protein
MLGRRPKPITQPAAACRFSEAQEIRVRFIVSCLTIPDMTIPACCEEQEMGVA